MNTEFLGRIFADNPVWMWFLALGIFVGVLSFFLVLRTFFTRFFERRYRRTGKPWAERGAELAKRTTFLFLLMVAIFAGSLSLKLPPEASRVIRALIVTLFLGQLGLWGSRLATLWVTRLASKRRAEGDTAAATTLSSLGLLIRVAIWAIVVLLVLQNLGVNVTALAAGVGIAGIAIAFAAQSILADLFSFLAIVVDKPFLVGDFIVAGQVEGTVERIGIKTTRIRSLTGEEVVVSNSELLKGWIHDYTKMNERRVVFHFAVDYQTPPEKLASIPNIVRQVIEATPNVRFDRAHFKEYGEFGLLFEVVYFVLTPSYRDYMDAQQAINLGVHKRFTEEGIRFALPVRRVVLERG
ncbi:MAG: mechanosensitive ion channel family protein [Candidatus Bipolaricaulota bacterium]|nr:mechanosensitive ion channel family protein [Candidatus Bipolaricaulota bacterium]MDW8126581.1 mechanosensitive ion channel family protein [Candidatus Bipolaricaulota bacterium]